MTMSARKAHPREKTCCWPCLGWGQVRGEQCATCHGRGRTWPCLRGSRLNQRHDAHASGVGGTIWCLGWTPPPPPPRPYTHGERRYRPDGTTSTVIRVHRCCNGCGYELGDPTEHELECAVAGEPLPDVTEECPRCRPVKAELVHVPMPRVRFGYRRVLAIFHGELHLVPHHDIVMAYRPPANTCDPRAAACTDHHVGCDCREAELAENTAEWRSEVKMLDDAFENVLAGHDSLRCRCTGCVIAVASSRSWWNWAPPEAAF